MILSSTYQTAARSGALLFLCLSIVGCHSGSSVVDEGGSEVPPTAVFNASEAPAAIEDLITPVESNRQSVAINNADGLMPLAAPLASSSVTGWTSTGECGNGDVGLNAGGGKRAFFTLSTACEMTQISSSVLDGTQAISLQFSLSADSRLAGNLDNQAASLVAEILAVSDAGDQRVLRAETVALDAASVDWQAQQLLVNFDESAGSENNVVGVRFRVEGDANFVWYLSDVVLDVFDKSDNAGDKFSDSWAGVCEQIWVGSSYWANRNRDWHVSNGRLESRNGSRYRPLRTVHRLTSHMSASPEDFELSVQTSPLATPSANSFSGILFGAGNGLDYRAAALIHNRSGRNGGLIAGIDAQGRVFLHDNGVVDARIATSSKGLSSWQAVTLGVTGKYIGNSMYQLIVATKDANGQVFSSVSADVAAQRILGNIGLVSNPGGMDTDHWFDQFKGSGAKLMQVPDRAFGPVLMSTYTVSRDELTLNAQFPQMCVDKYAQPTLSVKRDEQWEELASADIDPAAFVARFSVGNWDANKQALYRVGIKSSGSDASQYFYGIIKAAPGAADEFVLAIYNCRPGVILSDEEGWIQQNNLKPFTWSAERIVYPHAELMANAAEHNSSMLAFLGDQLYEFDPNGFIDKSTTELLIEDYFWKWQQFVFSVREYTRNTPSFVIPDDHDVYQGNVWGAGGIPANAEGDGGYVFPSEFVQIVQKTQTGSLPRSQDTQPVAQGIDVYFTDIVYGGVGLAVLEDRKFKSSPSTADADALLLGDRQLAFLDTWARDWDGQQLKLTVSQSPFAQSTTHTGANSTPNRLDKDSNGWPKLGRDKAVVALRKASSPHVSGDQHLGMSLRHGVAQQNDAVYSFAGPSMLNIFPRIWDPENTEAGPGDRAVDYVGEYTDAHGNLINVLAAANPDSYYLPRTQRSWQKDQLGIGYGIVRMNKAQRSYAFAAWPASVEPLAAGASPYAGWPIMVDQTDNDGRTPVGFLAQRTAPVTEPVVVVTNEASQELVYARRYSTATIDLPVFDAGASYTVDVSDPASGYQETFTGQRVVQ